MGHSEFSESSDPQKINPKNDQEEQREDSKKKCKVGCIVGVHGDSVSDLIRIKSFMDLLYKLWSDIRYACEMVSPQLRCLGLSFSYLVTAFFGIRRSCIWSSLDSTDYGGDRGPNPNPRLRLDLSTSSLVSRCVTRLLMGQTCHPWL